MTIEPPFTIGIEEEYLLVDRQTLALAEAPEGLIAACKDELADKVSPEFLQCQIEVGTGICHTVAEARADLSHLRRVVARHAGDYGLAPIAASCHPVADWKDQSHRDRDRYNQLEKDLAGVARRMLICGMHVHVGIPDQDSRITFVNKLKGFLPYLHALSASSPFWQGEDTGMASYRLTVFDNLPRTGLPPHLADWAEYDGTVQTLVDLGLIEDSSKIWWDLRPSANFPTIESRICDVCPAIEDTLTLAAMTQSLTRMLWRRAEAGEPWPEMQNFIISENRWRAQRYGVKDGLIDFGRRAILPFAKSIEEMIALTSEDSAALDCAAEVTRARQIVTNGTSSDRQRRIYQDAMTEGADTREALNRVTASLVAEFGAGL